MAPTPRLLFGPSLESKYSVKHFFFFLISFLKLASIFFLRLHEARASKTGVDL